LALARLAAIDEITMVAAPGLVSASTYTALTSHCENLKDRVAILDSVESDSTFDTGDFSKLQNVVSETNKAGRPQNSTYSAFYFPWIQVFDPATSLIQSKDKGNGLIYVPPSGHIAGIYARSDSTRGVFKAPANEALQGVTGLKYSLSKADQDSLNDDGVNLIRPLTGAFRVWGARTVGGDANGEYRYISTRRYFNYLRESIEEGTQFVVFEPNSPALWERIKRTVGGFLLNEWRSGALFGTTPDKAFFIRCDADTNPPEIREAGQVVTEIGVAIVKPAEFVIFRIQQTAG
jgi:phage tail sheath protein FI